MIVNPNQLSYALAAAKNVDPNVNEQAVEAALEAALESYRLDVQADLDTRMKLAGMMTIDEILSDKNPINRFMAHAGVTNMNHFEQWLIMRHREFAHMRIKYELGDEPKDELYEWVYAHSAALAEVIANFKKANS